MKIDKQKADLAMARAMLLSRRDIAKKADMPEATVANLLAGRHCKPVTAGKVAHALGIDVTEILADE